MPCPTMSRPWSGSPASLAMTVARLSQSDLLGHLNVVQGHYGKLFEGDPAGTAKLPAVDYGAGPDDPRLLEHLATLGFKKPSMVARDRAAMDDRRVSRVQVGNRRGKPLSSSFPR